MPGQFAIQTALGGYQSINELIVPSGRLYKQRELAYDMLTSIPGVTCVKPQAALYMFPRLDPKLYPIQNDQQFILDLLLEERVLLVQGTGFNWTTPDHFRVVFLPNLDDLTDSINRIARFSTATAAPFGLSGTATRNSLLLTHSITRSMEPIKVGLLGFGTVGSGTFTVLGRNQEESSDARARYRGDAHCGAQPGQGAGCARRRRRRRADHRRFHPVVDDPSIAIIAEMIGGTGIAREPCCARSRTASTS